MTVPITLGLAGALLGLSVFCGWRGSRPPDLRRGPRMIPWRPLMVASAVSFLVLLVHLVNLMGVTTGR